MTSNEGFSSCYRMILLVVQLEQRRDPVGGSSAVDTVNEDTVPAGENDVPANG